MVVVVEFGVGVGRIDGVAMAAAAGQERRLQLKLDYSSRMMMRLVRMLLLLPVGAEARVVSCERHTAAAARSSSCPWVCLLVGFILCLCALTVHCRCRRRRRRRQRSLLARCGCGKKRGT